jgi:tetratricopeptide (TPR) repeat protein
MKTPRSFRLFLGLVLGSAGLFAAEAKVKLYPDLSAYTRKVTTASPGAQRYFNQGLAFTYGFDHEMAIKSFQEAARLDPDCAMAWWGIANACGPNINLPMVDPDHATLAWDAITRAQAAAAHGTPVEQALITAQAQRFVEKHSADRRALDVAYADAMRAVWHAHPDDADVGVLFAEAMMDLRPWDQWRPDGQPQPGTEEVVAALKTVIKLNPDHPMGLHLVIHANEASATPEVALPAANRLRTQRSLIGHMEHMASHIDVRMGNWREAVESNERAIQSDLRYRRDVGEPQGILFGYMAHNRHMQAYAAMMTGQSAIALRTIRAMVTELPPGAALPEEIFPVVDGFAAMPYEVLVRYGRWDEILAEPRPAEKYVFSRALLLAARGIALAATGRPAEARAEQTAFLAAKEKVSPAPFSTNPMTDLAAVAEHMLAGEILIGEGKTDAGLAELREAVRREDALRYDEPPGWIIPVRHSLGATLMRAGHYAEAEQVYRADLKKLPNNGWSLFGLAESLEAQGRKADAKPVRGQFKKIWAQADTVIKSSCFCQPGG